MPRSTAYNPLVLSKTRFLQRVQEAVSDGYVYFTWGVVPILKAQNLARRFKDLYLVHIDKNARFRRKRAGLGNARLLLTYCLDDPTALEFMLLVSNGEHPAHQLEKLKDARKAPVVYKELELVALTLKGRHRPCRTWRLSAAAMAGWRERLHLHTVRYDKVGLFGDWSSLYMTPGFAGIRRQVGELVSFWRGEWRQHRRDDPCPMRFREAREGGPPPRPGIRKEGGMYWPQKGFPNPSQLPRLFYVRKQADCGDSLSVTVRNEKKRLAEHQEARERLLAEEAVTG